MKISDMDIEVTVKNSSFKQLKFSQLLLYESENEGYQRLD